MSAFRDADGTPLRRDIDGDLVPAPDHPDIEAARRRAAIRRCREAINRTCRAAPMTAAAWEIEQVLAVGCPVGRTGDPARSERASEKMRR